MRFHCDGVIKIAVIRGSERLAQRAVRDDKRVLARTYRQGIGAVVGDGPTAHGVVVPKIDDFEVLVRPLPMVWSWTHAHPDMTNDFSPRRRSSLTTAHNCQPCRGNRKGQTKQPGPVRAATRDPAAHLARPSEVMSTRSAELTTGCRSDRRPIAVVLRDSRSMVAGTVKFWNDDEGWGELTSPEVPGELWAHFSFVVGTGYRSLSEGERVRFDPEHCPTGQDGYFWRARHVVSVDEGSEFAGLSDQEIEERIKELEAETEADSGADVAYRVNHRLGPIDPPEGKPDPSLPE